MCLPHARDMRLKPGFASASPVEQPHLTAVHDVCIFVRELESWHVSIQVRQLLIGNLQIPLVPDSVDSTVRD